MTSRTGYYISDQYAMYFLTFTIVGWVDLFTRKECKDIIIDSLKYCTRNKGLIINAYVIMDSHIHLIAMADESSQGLSSLIRDFKKYTSKKLLKWIRSSNKESRKEWLEVIFQYHAKYNTNNSRFQIWMQNNHPILLLHPKFIYQKLNYIHQNPVSSKIVYEGEDYIYSSARNYAYLDKCILDVEILDFGTLQGYLMY